MAESDEPDSTKNGDDLPAEVASAVKEIDQAVETLPLEKRTRVHRIMTQVIARSYQGPLPPPEVFRGYQEIIPNLPERIVSKWEEEGQHRHRLEERMVEAAIEAEKRGQWMAFILALVLSAAGIAAYLTGHDVVAGAIFTTTIVGVVTVFVIGKKSAKAPSDDAESSGDELQQKKRELPAKAKLATPKKSSAQKRRNSPK